MAGAVFAIFLLLWWYGVIPHQWLVWGDGELGWRTDKHLARPRPATSRSPITYQTLRDLVAVDHLRRRPRAADHAVGRVEEPRQAQARRDRDLAVRPSAGAEGLRHGEDRCQPADAGVPRRLRPPGGRRRPGWPRRSSPSSSSTSTSPSASCARAASTSARGSASTWSRPTPIDEAIGTEQPGDDPGDHVVFIDRRRRLHPVRAVRRPLPDRRHHPRQGRRPGRRRRRPPAHQQPRLRLRHAPRMTAPASTPPPDAPAWTAEEYSWPRPSDRSRP